MISRLARLSVFISLVALMTMPLASCGYIGPENIYGISTEDHQLLYQAQTTITSQVDYLLDVEMSLEGQTITLNMEGDGGFLIEEAELLPGMVFAMTGTAQNDQGVSGNISFEIRTVDGVIYMLSENLDTGETDGWQAIDLMQGFEDMTGVDLDAPAGSEESILSEPIGTVDELGLEKYTTVRFIGEEDVRGVATKHFLLEVDLMAFLQSEEFAAYLMSSSEMSAEIGAGQGAVGTLDPQMLVPVLRILMPMIFPTFELSIDQYIGIDDGWTRRSETEFSMVMDLSSLALMTADPSAAVEPIALSLYLNTYYHDFEERFEIEAPDDATVIPMGEFLNPFGQ